MANAEQKPQAGSDTFGPIIWRPEDYVAEMLAPEAEAFHKSRKQGDRVEATRALLRKTVEITGLLLPKQSKEWSAPRAVEDMAGSCQASTKVSNGLLAAHDIESDVLFDGVHFWNTRRVGRDNWYFDGYFGIVSRNDTPTDSLFTHPTDPKAYPIEKANIGLNRIKRSQRDQINLAGYNQDEGWSANEVSMSDGVDLGDSTALRGSSDNALFIPHAKAGIYFRDSMRHYAATRDTNGNRLSRTRLQAGHHVEIEITPVQDGIVLL